MDISFNADDIRFNYRVCAVIIDSGRILAVRDDAQPYYYLPGGRVKTGEPAEKAILREITEELCIEAEIIRPLWFNQSFFNEDVTHRDYHELGIYFLIDISKTDLLKKGDKFTIKENNVIHRFEWIEFKRLETEYFYPLFLKKEIFSLPENFTLRTEYQ